MDVEQEPFDRFTILYFGTLRRFVGLDEFLAGFQRFVRRPNLSPNRFKSSSSGQLDDHSRETADRFGVTAYLHSHPRFITGEYECQEAADWLLLVIQPECVLQILASSMIPSSQAPIFAVSSNTEANEIISEAEAAGISVSGQDPEAVASALEDAYTHRHSDRYEHPKSGPYTAESAARAMSHFR